MRQTRSGLVFGVGAYLLWGLFPAYFALIAVVNPLEVVPWRVLATLAFCVVVVSVTRRWGQVRAAWSRRRGIWWLVLSAVMLYANWQIFIIAVMTGHVIEASLGYFINPLFTVLLGVLFRHEQLTRLQWVAVAVATVGVVIASIGYGSVPWISLGLAITFGLYGLARKGVDSSIDGITGLTVETCIVVPIGIVQLVVLGVVGPLTAFSFGADISFLVLLSGVMTAIPLILFGEAARRLPLSYLGFIQFITPILGFLYGYIVLAEQMTTGRWVGFVAVWVALIVLIIDMVRQTRRSPEAETGIGSTPLE